MPRDGDGEAGRAWFVGSEGSCPVALAVERWGAGAGAWAGGGLDWSAAAMPSAENTMVLSSSSMNAAAFGLMGPVALFSRASGPLTVARITAWPKYTSAPSKICCQSSARSTPTYTPERLPPSRTQSTLPSQ